MAGVRLLAKKLSQRPDVRDVPWNVDLRRPGSDVLLIYLNDLPLDQTLDPQFLDHSDLTLVGAMPGDRAQVIF